MFKQNIANFILYDLSHTDIHAGLKVNKGLINDVVEGWDKQIYIVPNQQIRIKETSVKNFNIM